MERISRENLFMNIALLVSLRSTCLRSKVGAVIVKNNRIISLGYAGSPPGEGHCIDVGCKLDPETGGCVRTVHAEKNAILFRIPSRVSVVDGDLYITLSPCQDCAELIFREGIKRVIYYQEYRDKSPLDYLKHKGIEVNKSKYRINALFYIIT